jgi:hypothetical protein
MNNTLQILCACVLVFFLLALGDFIPFLMPNMNEMVVLLVVTASMLVWAGFILYEKATDEREVVLRMQGGRIAYLSGIVVLTSALVIQGLQHNIDPWILLTLGVMVVVKLGVRIFLE